MSLNYGLPITVSAQMPYQPSEGEILYVEGRHTIQIERWRIEYYKEMLCESVNNPVEYTEGYFSLIVKLLNEPSVWDDFKQKQRRRIETEIIANYRFTDYVEIAPSLLVYDSKDELGQYKFQQFEIGDKGIWDTLQEVFAYMDHKDETDGVEYINQSEFPWQREELLHQMQECARKLIDIGMDKNDIYNSLFSSLPLQNLIITKNGDVVLESSLNGIFVIRKPIRIAPLERALYLLFLRHPEGISFSRLPDYREELMEIYKKLLNARDTPSIRKRVEDVTDPNKNTFHEKCARIRRVFINKLDTYRLAFYCISGDKGDIKKIVLDRAYVHWEEDGL